ncbi:hypothetical protein [Clostridium ljungdahlii]|uniref:hypothetical protein n=1 Tax=Clostridium ljungdahlii TaxID=1538 RepID=UPI00195D4A33|nr:hypothetical protein [Clostridium ljungdahlii]
MGDIRTLELQRFRALMMCITVATPLDNSSKLSGRNKTLKRKRFTLSQRFKFSACTQRKRLSPNQRFGISAFPTK